MNMTKLKELCLNLKIRMSKGSTMYLHLISDTINRIKVMMVLLVELIFLDQMTNIRSPSDIQIYIT